MNVPLLRKIIRRITAHPEELNMGNWCDTASCIAGHACLASGYAKGAFDTEVLKNGIKRSCSRAAQEELGLSNDQATKLFYTTSWPQQYYDQYSNEVDVDDQEFIDPTRIAKITCARIEHFIETGE